VKNSIFGFVVIVFFNLTYAQEIDQKQFMIGVNNVNSQQEIVHTIEAIGIYWEYDDGWLISTDPDGEGSEITTTGNSNFSYLCGWPGWDFFWLDANPDYPWAIGFYEVYNDYNDEYFYIDCRVDAFGTNGTGYNPPDFWVYLNSSNDHYYFDDSSSPQWNPVTNSQVLRIWEVHGVNPPTTNSLTNFWSNVLVVIEDLNNHPRFAWGPYPDNIQGTIIGFRIYRCAHHTAGQPGSFSLFATVDENVFEYTDTTATVGTDVYANSYYIKCIYTNDQEQIIETSATNSVEILLAQPDKRSSQNNSAKVGFSYELRQNYPNPFNPVTKINYSVKNSGFVILKVYNILGTEMATLVNEVKQVGNYEILFNASELPSGIYLYQLSTGNLVLSKKMVLVK
jgi:hypothetical protein